MKKHDESTENDWTPDERELFAALPRERIPPQALKDRTLDAVRSQLPAATRFAAGRAYAVLLGTAAAIIIFVAGTLVGYAAARRATPGTGTSHVASHDAVATAKRDTATINQLRYVVWY